MRSSVVRLGNEREIFERGFEAVRRELEFPRSHRPASIAEAETVARRGPVPPPEAGSDRHDLREIPFVAIDPPGSRDLDQAYWAESRKGGYRIRYAIADVAAFVAPDGPLATEALERGVTYYSPDRRLSLYPNILGEGAASLLPDVDRPALVWELLLDADGELESARLERATVRSRAALTYAAVQTAIDGKTADEPLRLLSEIGQLRRTIERTRGGVSLEIPAQEIQRTDTGYQIRYDVTLPVENWNAQISLLAGMAAAGIMLENGTGLLRTLPPPRPDVVAELRAQASALAVDWPADVPYPEFIRSLDSRQSTHAALMVQATKVFRGAGYLSFVDNKPELSGHAAIAADYAHVTAPLRRVADRYANELLVAVQEDRPMPEWVLSRLDDLPRAMGEGRRREGALDRAVVDFVEAIYLAERVGEEFVGVAVSVADDGDGMVQLRDPAVVAPVDGAQLRLGEEVRLKLLSSDPDARKVVFARA